VRKCVPEMESILNHYHTREVRDHFSPTKTTAKVLQSGFYWPLLFKDVYAYVNACDACQSSGNISRRNKLPLNNIFEVEIFSVRGINFMGLFSSSFSNQFILVAIDFVSKWEEIVALPSNDARVVENFKEEHLYKIWYTTSNHQ